jgi:hypothetical protein
MNYSTAIFLINQHARMVAVCYEPEKQQPLYHFKTLDASIAVGDLVVVPTDTRHKFTVCKVEAVDVDVDFDSSTQFKWIAGKFDAAAYEKVLGLEELAISQIRLAENRKKRVDLRNNLLAQQAEDLKTLEIADFGEAKALPAS